MSTEDVDWSKFLPAGPLPDAGDKVFHPGEVWAWGGNGRYGASVFTIGEEVGAFTWGRTRLVGDSTALDSSIQPGSSMACTSVLVRHADGRWASGFHAGGPCAPQCGKVNLGETIHCTSTCRDRAAAKASAPTVERLTEGWERLSEPGAHPVGTCCSSDCEHKWTCDGCSAVAIYGKAKWTKGACDACARSLGAFASPVTDEPTTLRSSKERPPRVGDRLTSRFTDVPRTVIRIDPERDYPIRFRADLRRFEDGYDMATWNKGAFTIISEGPVTDDRGGVEPTARRYAGVRYWTSGFGRLTECDGCEEEKPVAAWGYPGAFSACVDCAPVGELAAPKWNIETGIPQWLIDERALMQSAPPVQVLPEFPRSKIERDNAMFRPRFQRSPRYVRGGR